MIVFVVNVRIMKWITNGLCFSLTLGYYGKSIVITVG